LGKIEPEKGEQLIYRETDLRILSSVSVLLQKGKIGVFDER
jgi:hypothetical protein